jgi:hypothetical protein
MDAVNWSARARRALGVFAVAAIVACRASPARCETTACDEGPAPASVATASDDSIIIPLSAISESPSPEVSESSQLSQEATSNEGRHAPPWVLFPAAPVPDRGFTIDYRYRALCSSEMWYAMGEPDISLNNYTTMRRSSSTLRFPLDSSWHGLQVGVDKPIWGLHVEWLTGTSLSGEFTDHDSISAYGYYGSAVERWNEAQMLTLDVERKVSDSVFGLPVEVWPVSGFRWQRLDLATYNSSHILAIGQVKSLYPADNTVTYNQQYYTAYVGGQLRKTIAIGSWEIQLAFQGDWGYTWAYSIDNHCLDELYRLLSTQGDSWHLGLTAEVPLSQRLSIGVQTEHVEIHTTGKMWQVYEEGGSSGAWTDGVGSYSNQTMFTGFARLHY